MPNPPHPPPTRALAAHSSSSSSPFDRSSDSGPSTSLTNSSKEVSRQTTPFQELNHPTAHQTKDPRLRSREEIEAFVDDGYASDDLETISPRPTGHREAMPSDLRNSMEDDKANYRDPLLAHDRSRYSYDRTLSRQSLHSRTTSMKEVDPQELASQTTKRRYVIAAGFLLISLVSFAVQTETAVYIQHTLHWNKAYCMM